MHDITLITTIALSLGAALLFGLLARLIGLSPIVGYLLAGVAAGPHTPGFIADVKIAGQLAEIGVILLMFGVGMHFSLRDLLSVRSIAIPGALGQSAVATLACAGLALAAGWSLQAGLILGIAVSVASTVVLLRALIDHGSLDSPEGHAAVGWLIVEDILTVLVLVLLPPLASGLEHEGGLWQTLGVALLKLVVLIAIVMVAGAWFVPWLLLRVARLRSRELFTLAVLVMAICIATVSYVAFGASMALGAFLAGMVVGQSHVSHQAADDLLPMRDAFAVLFFVSVGMLLDYRAVLDSPGLVLGVVAIIIVVKPLAAIAIVLLRGHPLRTALTVAGGLAQIGEFSFIVADLAKRLGMMPGNGSNVIVAGALISIGLNPLIFRGMLALEPRLSSWTPLSNWLLKRGDRRGALANEALSGQTLDAGAVVVGYGPVGRTVTRLLAEFGINPIIVETNVDAVLELQQRGRQALFGDATRPEILRAAGVDSAAYLVVTIPKADVSLRVIQAAREVAPLIRVLARVEYIGEREAFTQAGASIIRFDEAESAAALAEALLQEIDVPSNRIDVVVAQVRRELSPRRFRSQVLSGSTSAPPVEEAGGRASGGD